MLNWLHRAQIFGNFDYDYFNSTVDCFDQTIADDCFIIPKIHYLHRARVCMNTNKKIERKHYSRVSRPYLD